MSTIYKAIGCSTDGEYTLLPRDVVTDPQLSFEAIGFYGSLATCPDGATFEGLVALCSDDAVVARAALDELLAAGHVEVVEGAGDGWEVVDASEPFQRWADGPPPQDEIVQVMRKGDPGTATMVGTIQWTGQAVCWTHWRRFQDEGVEQ